MERKTLLIGLLALTGLGFGADAAYRTYVEKPFQDQADTRAKKEKEKSSYRTKLVNVKTLVRDLPELVSQSLPAQPAVARQRYQAWWWQKVKSHQWENPSVDIGQPSAIVLDKKRKADAPPVHSISGTIRGVATLQQVTELLDDFYATQILHHIDSIQLNPVAGGKRLSVSLSISALSLEQATEQSQLPNATDSDLILVQNNVPSNPIEALINPQQLATVPITETTTEEVTVANNSDGIDSTVDPSETTARETSMNQTTSGAVDVQPNALATNEMESTADVTSKTGPAANPQAVQTTAAPETEQPWQNIVKRNVFQAGGGMQIANKVVLSAITSDAKGNQQAWFRITDTKQTQILNQGETFQLGVLSLKVIDAADNYVIVLLEGSRVRIKIGDNIASGIVVGNGDQP